MNEPMTGSTPIVEFRGCDIGYEGHAVVHGLDLTILAGEVLGVLGANGSGKSTTIRGLLGLTPVLAGEVRLFGTPRGQPTGTRCSILWCAYHGYRCRLPEARHKAAPLTTQRAITYRVWSAFKEQNHEQ